jgi:hypothetical protein
MDRVSRSRTRTFFCSQSDLQIVNACAHNGAASLTASCRTWHTHRVMLGTMALTASRSGSAAATLSRSISCRFDALSATQLAMRILATASSAVKEPPMASSWTMFQNSALPLEMITNAIYRLWKCKRCIFDMADGGLRVADGLSDRNNRGGRRREKSAAEVSFEPVRDADRNRAATFLHRRRLADAVAASVIRQDIYEPPRRGMRAAHAVVIREATLNGVRVTDSWPARRLL